MKPEFIALATASIILLAACGNNSETTPANTDTVTTSKPSTEAETHASHDSMSSDNTLKEAMNEMMTKMHTVPLTGDFDIDFANMMVEHHQGALSMAQLEQSKGKDEKMKSKGGEIITKQQKEIQELKDFVKNYKASGMKHGEGELQKSMQQGMDKMKSLQMTGDIDKDFATMMISHHEDGISMAKLEAKHGMSKQLKQMAQKSISDQQKDIKEFQDWLSTQK